MSQDSLIFQSASTISQQMLQSFVSALGWCSTFQPELSDTAHEKNQSVLHCSSLYRSKSEGSPLPIDTLYCGPFGSSFYRSTPYSQNHGSPKIARLSHSLDSRSAVSYSNGIDHSDSWIFSSFQSHLTQHATVTPTSLVLTRNKDETMCESSSAHVSSTAEEIYSAPLAVRKSKNYEYLSGTSYKKLGKLSDMNCLNSKATVESWLKENASLRQGRNLHPDIRGANTLEHINNHHKSRSLLSDQGGTQSASTSFSLPSLPSEAPMTISRHNAPTEQAFIDASKSSELPRDVRAFSDYQFMLSANVPKENEEARQRFLSRRNGCRESSMEPQESAGSTSLHRHSSGSLKWTMNVPSRRHSKDPVSCHIMHPRLALRLASFRKVFSTFL